MKQAKDLDRVNTRHMTAQISPPTGLLRYLYCARFEMDIGCARAFVLAATRNPTEVTLEALKPTPQPELSLSLSPPGIGVGQDPPGFMPTRIFVSLSLSFARVMV